MVTTSDRPPNVPQLRCVKRDYLRHFQNEFAVGTELWSDGGASLSFSLAPTSHTTLPAFAPSP